MWKSSFSLQWVKGIWGQLKTDQSVHPPSDQGIYCLHLESLHTVECLNGADLCFQFLRKAHQTSFKKESTLLPQGELPPLNVYSLPLTHKD